MDRYIDRYTHTHTHIHTHTHTHTEYVLHMSKEDALAWLDKEPLSAAGCYASVDVFEMQQHWSNIAA